MNRSLVNRVWAKRLALSSLLGVFMLSPILAQNAASQAASSDTTQLLGKAHALEVRGRMDMARQVWQQVLLSDPKNVDALAGMARAAKLEGKQQESNDYLNKLRAINPNDPNIQRIQEMGTAKDTSSQLQEAGQLAQSGQYARAMTLLRQVYGTNPPPGDAALSYYQTEAATEDGRPHAIAGLRALIDRFPTDSRYQVTLGKILTYNPRTRDEGRKLLQKHPSDPEAQEALRQSLVWDAQSPATAGDIAKYLKTHKDPQLAAALAQTEANARRSGQRVGAPAAPPPTPEQLAQQAELRERNAESQAAYNALNGKRYQEAESRFQAMLAKDSRNPQALAGLGYVRMGQSNFGGAITYLQQAEQNGSHDAGVDKALKDSQFYYTMQVATTALNENDLNTAQSQFSNAAHMRPRDPSPLLGLGGTLMKAQQPVQAVPVFSEYVRLAPNDKAAWRGLFMSQYGAADYSGAISTDARIPAGIKRQLIHDPEYLRTLASTYQALGRDADAQRVLRSALDMPFPADSRGMRADMQLQYAALLVAANRPDQAAGLYRQVLEGDSTNTNAYEGLINLDHSSGRDAEAYQILQSMPPASYEQAMQTQGFQTTVAAVYSSQGHYDLAQQTLETFIQNQQATNQPVPVSAETQLAGIYLQHGDTAHAYPIYATIVRQNPGNTDAWNGLIGALHTTGHDQEALAEIQQIPPNTRVKLESDPAYLQTVGSIYAGLKQYNAAMMFYGRVQQRYVSQHLAPPPDIDIQEAWLLFNAHNEPLLRSQLLMLGGRGDLSDQQRLTVQTIWANWAVRRANENIAQGNYKRALAILNAAAKAFPDNPDVLKALGSGYAAVGLSKQAVEIYRAQDLSQGTLDDYRAAVGAAMTANDLKDAEVWLRFGLDQYPRDGQLLVLAAKFETARGDSGRAAEYYRASLKVFPKEDPGSMLTDEMLRPLAVRRVQKVEQSQDLATLLSEADPRVNRNAMGNNGIDVVDNPRPYLPSYMGTSVQAPIQVDPSLANGQYSVQRGVPGGGYLGNTTPGVNAYPQQQPYYGNPNGVNTTPSYDPSSAAQQQQLQQQRSTLPAMNPTNNQQQQLQQRNSTLRNYTPQSQLQSLAPRAETSSIAKPVIYLHPDPAMEAKYGPYVSYDPSAGLPQTVEVAAVDPTITAHFVTASFHPQSNYPQPTQQETQAPVYTPPAYVPPAKKRTQQTPTNTPTSASQDSNYTPQIDYHPPVNGYTPPKAIHLPPSETRQPVKATKPAPTYTSPQQDEYVPVASQPAQTSTDQSFPTPTPGFKSPSAATHGPITPSRTSAYPNPNRTATQNAAQQGTTPDGTPIVPYIPATRHSNTNSAQSVRDRAAAIRRNQQDAPIQLTGQAHPPTEEYTSEPDAQIQNTQYNPSSFQNGEIPQPGAPQDNGQLQNNNTQSVAPSQNVDRQTSSYGQQYPQPNTRGTAPAPTRRRTHSTPKQQPAPQQQPSVTYPSYSQPLGNPGYPSIPAPYPLAPPPSDYQLQQKDVPPLRGYFDPRVDETTPLTDRQQAELDLATLEGSYSSWVGASVIGSYRSGTKGIDRMASVAVPFEASLALGKYWRLTVIPMPIFLDSGVLAPNGNLGNFPVFGSVIGTSTTTYPQQYSEGIGGEAQLTSNTFSIAGGYSAYGFLVRNGIGRVRWQPGHGHFTLFGGRDAVKDTQLSYAGLRDPGQPNAFTLGPIWGGVVQTGGGVRIDAGNEKSGLYIQGEGAELTGYHVFTNRKYDGTFGAYFRAHVWPQYGSLNVGAAMFGEHYDYNERVESYGWGGYFSPNIYFLFAVPVTFNGHYKDQIHYTINGSVGVQTFQENSEPYYPLDQNMQLNLESTATCTGLAVGAAQPCGYIPSNSNTGLNYSIDARVSYQVNDHWYIGGFLTGNNTNNYNTVSGGFFARYTFKSQSSGKDYPTGLFPVDGFRPLRVP